MSMRAECIRVKAVPNYMQYWFKCLEHLKGSSRIVIKCKVRPLHGPHSTISVTVSLRVPVILVSLLFPVQADKRFPTPQARYRSVCVHSKVKISTHQTPLDQRTITDADNHKLTFGKRNKNTKQIYPPPPHTHTKQTNKQTKTHTDHKWQDTCCPLPTEEKLRESEAISDGQADPNARYPCLISSGNQDVRPDNLTIGYGAGRDQIILGNKMWLFCCCCCCWKSELKSAGHKASHYNHQI